jgi:Rrf2 family protein
MLSFTKKTDYALIALRYLAHRRMYTVSAKEIAKAFKLPKSLVMSILKTLSQAGMLNSSRGIKGGYRLIAELKKVSIHDLIELLEGPVRLADCVVLAGQHGKPRRGGGCKVGKGCPIQAPIQTLHGEFVAFLRGTKLADLLLPETRPARRAKSKPAVALPA